MNIPRHAFVTVTDHAFFPGTLATVNSILEYDGNATIFVVVNHKRPLTPPQLECFAACDRVRVVDSRGLDAPGRYINAWELKAYAVHDLCDGFDVIIGIDSDCLLCSNVDDLIARCHAKGGFLGGSDGNGTDYDDSYRVYGISTPVRNPKYMSTSLYFCAVTPQNLEVLKRWIDCCGKAVFNCQGDFPGHGDQGVLNAVLFAAGRTPDIELLDNRLWSQHWTYWDSIIDFRGGEFINVSAERRRQRSFHCGGAEKFWCQEHRDRVLETNALQTYPYLWFLTMFWFGRCGNWTIDPFQFLPSHSHYLTHDLANFFPQIAQIYPAARERWNSLSDPMINRVLNGIPRAMSLGGGSMSEMIGLVEANPGIRRYVEIGSYEGGSILALGLRFVNRDIDFYSVESFMGSMNGTMDGHRLPLRRCFTGSLARFPSLRVKLIPGDAGTAASVFDDASVDLAFIDACHDTWAVLRDIDCWAPKVKPGGILAGDDYGWESVRVAVNERFPHANVTPSGTVWWVRT